MKRSIIVLFGLALATVVAAAVSLTRVGGADAVPTEFGASPRSTFSRAEARRFTDFPLYDVGESFQGWPLVAVLRRKDTGRFAGEHIRPNYVSFIYGDCLATDDQGCAPPLEIQISPACLYTPADIALPAEARLKIRGVTSSVFEEGAKLALVAGRSTVTIYGRARDDVVAAAGRLRGVNLPVEATDNLPAPAGARVYGTCR